MRVLEAPVTATAASTIAAVTGGFAAVGVSLDRWSAALVLGACAWSLVLAAGLLGRRAWAREAGLLTFLAFSVVSVPAAVGALLGTTADPHPLVGSVLALGNVAVVVLLALRGAAVEVERAEEVRTSRDDPELDDPAVDDAEVEAFRDWLETVSPEDFRSATGPPSG